MNVRVVRCTTCSDEGLPLRVVEVAGATGVALCRGEDGEFHEVVTELVAEAAPGDLLLVHAGVALALIDERAGAETTG